MSDVSICNRGKTDMNEQQNLETVKKAYQALAAANMNEFLAILATDVDWMMPEVPGIPFTGNCKGRTQVDEFFQALAEAEESLVFTQEEFVVTGSQVGVTGRYRARIRATDKTVETPFAHFFTVVDGQIHSFHEYYDTAAVASAYVRDSESEG